MSYFDVGDPATSMNHYAVLGRPSTGIAPPEPVHISPPTFAQPHIGYSPGTLPSESPVAKRPERIIPQPPFMIPSSEPFVSEPKVISWDSYVNDMVDKSIGFILTHRTASIQEFRHFLSLTHPNAPDDLIGPVIEIVHASFRISDDLLHRIAVDIQNTDLLSDRPKPPGGAPSMASLSTISSVSSETTDSSNPRRRLHPELKVILKQWFNEHLHNPYPTVDQLQMWAVEWHETADRLRQFFKNERYRYTDKRMKALWATRR